MLRAEVTHKRTLRVSFSPDGKTLAAAGPHRVNSGATVWLWNVPHEEPEQ